MDPYRYLSNRAIYALLAELNIDAGTDRFGPQIERLIEYDDINPEWRQQILNTPVLELSRLPTAYIYLYAAMFNIPSRFFEESGLPQTQLAHGVAACVLSRRLIYDTPMKPKAPIVEREMKIESMAELIQATQQGIVPISPNCVSILYGVDRQEVHEVLLKLAQYPIAIPPDHYNVLRRIHTTGLALAVEHGGVSKALSRLMTREELLFALSRHRMPQLCEESRRRFQRWKTMSSQNPEAIPVLIAIHEMYEHVSVDDALILIAKRDPLPMESIIFAVGLVPHSEIEAALGMVVPPNREKESYIQQNIADYRRVYTRPVGIEPPTPEVLRGKSPRETIEYLHQFTDEELFRHIGAYIVYRNRRDLVEGLTALCKEEQFFIPTVRRCRNAQTLLFSDTSDPDLFIIAYGTIQNYVGYEIDELMTSFHYEGNDPNDREFFFYRPDDIKQTFGLRDIKDLLNLLHHFPGTDKLVKHIEMGLEEINSKSDYNRSVIRDFNQVSPYELELVKAFFHQLFIAGMYMRRWRGPGHPYPIREVETHRSEMPDLEVTQALVKCDQILESLSPPVRSKIYNLKVVQCLGTQIHRLGEKLESVYNRIKNDQLCIRFGSSILIWTSYHYIYLLFREQIPNFSPHQVDIIT